MLPAVAVEATALLTPTMLEQMEAAAAASTATTMQLFLTIPVVTAMPKPMPQAQVLLLAVAVAVAVTAVAAAIAIRQPAHMRMPATTIKTSVQAAAAIAKRGSRIGLSVLLKTILGMLMKEHVEKF